MIARNCTLAVHELVESRSLAVAGSESIITEILGKNILVYYSLAVNDNIKVSKILYHWTLSLASFRFCETQCLHFTTRVFFQSAISPFLGGDATDNNLR